MANTEKRKDYRDAELLRQFGAKIREQRVAKGMTQKELAFACNDVDFAQISRVELGKVNFSVSYLGRIAKVLGLKIQDILPNEETHNDNVSQDTPGVEDATR